MRPMLAAPAPADGLEFPGYVSPKLDGIRGLINNGRAWTRTLEAVPNLYVQRMIGHSLLNGLDGELCVGAPWADDLFTKTMSGVMSHAGEPEFTYYVFDYWNGPQEQSYEQRLSTLRSAFAMQPYIGHPKLVLLEQHLVHNMDELEARREEYVERGYEGAMYRRPASPYKFGRSTANRTDAVNERTGQPLQPWCMLKLKKFSQGEAEILACTELMINANELEENNVGGAKRSTAQDGLVPAGRLGAFKVRDIRSGAVFGVGSGFDGPERDMYWQNRDKLIGLIIRYKHFEVGAKNAPRFPIFQGFRHPADIDLTSSDETET